MNSSEMVNSYIKWRERDGGPMSNATAKNCWLLIKINIYGYWGMMIAYVLVNPVKLCIMIW